MTEYANNSCIHFLLKFPILIQGKVSLANITSSDNTVFSDPHTSCERQEIAFDSCHFGFISSIHHTDARIMTNPGKFVSWGRETNTMHPTTCNKDRDKSMETVLVIFYRIFLTFTLQIQSYQARGHGLGRLTSNHG